MIIKNIYSGSINVCKIMFIRFEEKEIEISNQEQTDEINILITAGFIEEII